MSRGNVEQSLIAAEQALTHFVDSLDRAGFVEGAPAYRGMADVIIGQWLWAEQEGLEGLEPAFMRIADLADGVASRLRPYVAVMDRLNGIHGLAARTGEGEADSLAGRIVAALAAAKDGLTANELHRATGIRILTLRRELDVLSKRGVVAAPPRRTGRFTLDQRDGPARA